MKKKIFCGLLSVFLCVIVFLPITAQAETYNLSGTDMRISVDDSRWYVFTRDNIQNNPELDELGLSYDYMLDVFQNNDAYMDAILLYEDNSWTELLVRKKTADTGVANLSNYENAKVLELAEGLAKKQGAEDFCVYENQYKFAKLEYVDANYYLCEFATFVNKDAYTLTFQSPSPFTDWEYEEIENIVDSIIFDIDPSIKEKTSSSLFDSAFERAIGGAIVGGGAGAIGVLLNKKRKNKKSSDSENTNVE